jgi:gas vesicle structural protein
LGEELSRRNIAFVDLLDRVLHRGAVLNADITLSVADIDLVYVSLRALIASVDTVEALKARAVERALDGVSAAHGDQD